MQHKIHPKWYDEATVKCVCGNTFTTGAVSPQIEVDICAACHPFFTGQMKYIDTAGRVDAFRAKQDAATDKLISKTEKRRIKREKRIEEEISKPETLAEFKAQLKKS